MSQLDPLLHLAFFLSRATPLARWQSIGTLDREIALYRQLQAMGAAVTVVSSGGQEELAFQELLGQICILTNRRRLPPNLYSLLAPLVHWQALRNATLFKSNQLDGAWTAVIAGRVFGKPVVVRAGYPWAENYQRIVGPGLKIALMRRLARFSLRRADAVFATSDRLKQVLCLNYGLAEKRVHVVPNQIDTSQFVPDPETAQKPGQVLFVGRLSPEKNVTLLIRAAAGVATARLVIVGDGPQRAELEALGRQLGCEVRFTGALPNDALPELMRQSQIFALPSKFEGHPKVLLEAMACAMPVIGSDVEGINDLIRHGETGWLCPAEENPWQTAMGTLLSNPVERSRIGAAARRFVVDQFDLFVVAAQEMSLLRAVAEKGRLLADE